TVTLTILRLWDFESGDDIRDLNDDEDYGFGYAALSPDGKRLAQADFSVLKIRDAESGKLTRTIPLPGSWSALPTFSPDSTLVALPIGNSIGLFDVSSGKRLHHSDAAPADGYRSAAWSPSADRIVTGSGDGGIRVWEATTGKLIWHRLLAPVISPSGWNAGPAFVSFSPDGKTVVAAGRRDEPGAYPTGIVVVMD